MPNNFRPSDFAHFSRWLARRMESRASQVPSQATQAAAREARDEYLRAIAEHPHRVPIATLPSRLETLRLLAAADHDEENVPPQMTTARGFKVTLAYGEGAELKTSSICVLVQCPSEMLRLVQGSTAYLWSGNQRFELGQFDADGKAIGTLPAGIEISLSDLASGRIKLEEPDTPPSAGP